MVFFKLDREFVNILSIDRVAANLEGTAVFIELRNGNSTAYPLVKPGEQDYELCEAVAEEVAKLATIVEGKYPAEKYYWLVRRQIIDIHNVVDGVKLVRDLSDEARRQRGVSDVNSPGFNSPPLDAHILSQSRSGESGPLEEELPAEQLQELEEHWAEECEEQQVEETGTTVYEDEDGQPVEWDIEEAEKEAETEREDYDTKLVREALNILSQEDGLTPSQIQKKLIERKFFVTPIRLGMLLKKSGKAEKRGTRWYLKVDEENTEIEQPEQSNEERKEDFAEKLAKEYVKSEQESEDNLTWIEHGCYAYAVDEENDNIYLRCGKTGGRRILPYSKVRKLYEKLPQEASAKDIARIAEDLGLRISNHNEILVLMRVFSGYKDFDAELVDLGKGRNKGLRLVKNPDFSLREEIRQKLRQEREVIGISAEGFDVGTS